jgi:hypothetical protein
MENLATLAAQVLTYTHTNMIHAPISPVLSLGSLTHDYPTDTCFNYVNEQVHQSISFGNIVGNATKKVLNQTREFFQHGVMPKAGLDELDEFILKKMGTC